MKDIIRGEQAIITIELAGKRKSSEILDAFDASNFDKTIPSAAKVCFKAGTTLIEKTWDEAEINTVDAAEGILVATLEGSETDTFTANDVGIIEVVYVDDTDNKLIRKFQSPRAFQVKEKICT